MAENIYFFRKSFFFCFADYHCHLSGCVADYFKDSGSLVKSETDEK